MRSTLTSRLRYLYFITFAITLVVLLRLSPQDRLRHKYSSIEQSLSYAHPTTTGLAFLSHNKHGFPIYPDQVDSSPPQLVSPETKSADAGNDSLRVLDSHPRLFATQDQWKNLPDLIATDPYLHHWNDSICSRAKALCEEPPVAYNLDGGNGVLDTAREVQLRIKHWAYAYRMTQEAHWRDRIWDEILVASGNSSEPFGTTGDNWNTA